VTREEMISALLAQGVPHSKAVAQVSRMPGGEIVLKPSVLADREARLENLEQQDIVKAWRTLVGRVWSTSSVRKAKITPGFPDLLLTYRPWGVAIWWETKTAEATASKDGGRSPEQLDFAGDIVAAGHAYGFGTFADFVQWMDEFLTEPARRAAFADALDRAGLTLQHTAP
jgi:hypothetical protein